MKKIYFQALLSFLICAGLLSAAQAETALFNGLPVDPGKSANAAEAYQRIRAALDGGEPQVLIIEYRHTAREAARHQTMRQRLADYDLAKTTALQSLDSSLVEVTRDYSHLPMSVFRVNSSQGLEQLMGQAQIKAVYENGINRHYLDQSLPLIDQPVAEAGGFNGAGTAVAVLDTGVDYTHAAFGSCTAPGLPAATCKVAYAQDFTTTDDGKLDAHGHGTNVAGISLGVAPETRILALDVFDDGVGWDSDIIAAINWSIANQATYNIAAINMSLGDGVKYTAACPADSFATPITNAKAVGIFVAVASGNDSYTDGIASPACVPDAASVGAVYDAALVGLDWGDCADPIIAADQVTCFSNSAAFLDLLAPGALITAAGLTMGGTSQASPHVAGAAAVLAQVFPEESVNDWLSRLQATGAPVLDSRNAITKPRIDLDDAVSDPGMPFLNISDATVVEGDSGTSSIEFSVSRTDNSTDVLFEYRTNNGTAVSPVDYTETSGSDGFSKHGVLEKTISIPVHGDTTVELDETFDVELFNVSGAVAGDFEGVGSIQNDDSASVSIGDVSLDEGDAGTTSYTFTISLSVPVDTPVSVEVATASDTAVAGADFHAVTDGSILFSAGDLQQTFNVNVLAEDLVEMNEQFLVSLSNPDASGRNVTIGTNPGTGSIINDDAATVTIVDAEKPEEDSGAHWLAFEVQLSNRVDTDVQIEFNTLDGLAVAPSDFTAAVGSSVTIPAGQSSASVEVQLLGDLTVERDEQFQVNLSSPAASGRNVTLGDAQATGGILNDDSATLSIADLAMKEGSGGISVFQFNASLNNPVDTQVSVDYLSADDSAMASEGDYTTVSGVLDFAPGVLQQTIEVSVAGDALVELDEQFLVNLSNLGHDGRFVTLTDNQAQGMINNDDSATISIDDVSHEEGNAGATYYDFTVSLSAPVDVEVTVDNATSDDTAEAPADYLSIGGKTSISKGSQLKMIRVQVNGDTEAEPDEQFLLDLSNLVVAGRDVSFLKSRGTGQIINDDTYAMPGVIIVPANTPMLTSENGESASFTLVLNTEPGGNVSFSFESSKPDEGVVNPAAASFDAGNWDDARTVTITGQDDDYYDGDQSYQVTTTITASADSDYPAAVVDSLDIKNLDNNTGCTGVKLVLRPQDVPDGVIMSCGADESIVFDQGETRVERGDESRDARLDLNAPAIRVPGGHVLGVEQNSILRTRSPDP